MLELSFDRLDYHSSRDKVLGMLPLKAATADDLDSLLKVETEKDALVFIDKCAPLYKVSGERMYFVHPSQMDAETVSAMVSDVLNTVDMMRMLLNGKRMLDDGHLSGGHGFIFSYFDESEPRIENDEDFFLGRIACTYCFDFRENAKHAFTGLQTAGYDNAGNVTPVWVVECLSDGKGDTQETRKQALTKVLDSVITEMLSGARIMSNNLGFALSSQDFSAYLWYEFFNRLTNDEIRTCQTCGRLFVANKGKNSERGGRGNVRKNCSNTCKTYASNASNAIALIKRGASFEDAARKANVSKKALKRYIELNPNELGN